MSKQRVLSGTEEQSPSEDLGHIREELEERSARLHAILDAAVDGIVTIDEQGTIESVNPAVERIFGHRREDLVGKNVKVLMPAPSKDEHDDYLKNYLRTGSKKIIGIGREVQGLRKDGSVFPLEIAVSEVTLPGRRLFTGILRDISDRRAAEEQARLRLNELAHTTRLLELGEMTTEIAHEVNQPLAAIVSFAEACLRMRRTGTGDDALMDNALEQIAAQGERAGEIIHRLRRFARKGAGEREPVDINATVRHVLSLLRHETDRHQVRTRVELDEALPTVNADPVQIGQVLVNLVRNAVEAMEGCAEDRRLVTLRTSPLGSGPTGIALTVSDQGMGLPEGDPDRVFENFYTTKTQGMGVGLGICRSIIETHGGKLWAKVNADGGASFQLELPVGEAGTDDN